MVTHCSDGGGEDRISSLPDGVLSQILSRLSVKDATRTCVLSKHWEFKWTLIHDVHMKRCMIMGLLGQSDVPNNVSIVERILVHLHYIRSLSLSLRCHTSHDLSSMESLISALLLRHNVESLTLGIDGDEPDGKKFIIPRSLLNCSSLKTLSLEMICIWKLPARTCFPNLKSLDLDRVHIVNDVSNTDTLTLALPVLETLYIHGCKWLKVKYVEVVAPSLTSFISCSKRQQDGWNDYSIKVFSSKLVRFEQCGSTPENIGLSDSTVAYANFNLNIDYDILAPEESGFHVRKLMSQVPNVERMDITDVLRAIGQTKLGLPLPRFLKLRKLCLHGEFDAEGLLYLLQAAPYLKYLEIHIGWKIYHFDSFQCVPDCIVHHLEVVELYYIYCAKTNFKIEKFLLKNGLQLKTVFVSFMNCNFSEPESEIVEQLLTFPRGSSGLKIVSYGSD